MVEFDPSVFEDKAVVSDIPFATSVEIGRMLVAEGYKITSGYVVIDRNSAETVSTMLRDFNKQSHRENTSRQELETNGQIVGPYYSADANGEFCPVGVAIWSPATKSV
jgi:hypothetical protein